MKYYGILIDPSKDEVTKVEMTNSVVGLSELYSSIECEVVERIVLGYDEDLSIDLWIDEEGLLNGAGERIGCFSVGGGMIHGKGLIVLCDEDGESRAFKSSNKKMHELASMITESLLTENYFSHA